ncbi:hypothetical protein LSTR_LSTR010232 [Laodelphax striatellus]|uniref:Uncharacterized protein n=1 Tax=Laodelphax striatellus TaxID=195883 RepID=A0A482WQS7_LAOST|nr:hypothetical protein LSTR_LSTR010232 [Laodelphax striatellus]
MKEENERRIKEMLREKTGGADKGFLATGKNVSFFDHNIAIANKVRVISHPEDTKRYNNIVDTPQQWTKPEDEEE